MTTYITDTFTALAGGLTASRSKFQAASYTATEYTDQQLLSAYNGSGLVSRVVDMPASDATRMWREWQAEADRITAIEQVETQFNVKDALNDALIDARLFGDGYIFIDDGTATSEPLDPERSRGLRFVVKVDRWQISEGAYEYDPLSEFYNRPAWYDLLGGDTPLLHIHPSRIVHLVGRQRKSYNTIGGRMGQSVLAPIMDSLKGFDAVMANVADMTMEAKVDVMKINNLMQRVADPTELEAIQRKLQLAMYTKGTNGALILDMDDEDWQQKQMQFGTIPDIIDRFQMAASGDAKVPRSRLFGVQTGGLGDAGKSDTQDYYDGIKAMQENEIQPALKVLDKMIVKTALGRVPPEVHYNWRSLYQTEPKTLQEIGEKITKRYVDLVTAGIYPEELAFEQVTNELVEAGVAPGLEQAAEKWAAAVKSGDLDEGEEEDMIDV